MIGGIGIKVCGLTRAEDARVAAAAGADILGFIFYPLSPRKIGLEEFAALRAELPELPKVAVMVAPSDGELQAFLGAGFDFFQIHFPAGTAEERIAAWSAAVGKERLWLAPKLAPGEAFDAELLRWAGTILWDGYKKDAATFGGTGARSDWEGFRRESVAHPGTRWILAGGLGPDSAAEAARQTGARWLDFNSGVESSPGIKDPKRLFGVQSVLSAVKIDG